MEQFDVYPNPNPRTRDTYPYLVDIQLQVSKLKKMPRKRWAG